MVSITYKSFWMMNSMITVMSKELNSNRNQGKNLSKQKKNENDSSLIVSNVQILLTTRKNE